MVTHEYIVSVYMVMYEVAQHLSHYTMYVETTRQQFWNQTGQIVLPWDQRIHPL